MATPEEIAANEQITRDQAFEIFKFENKNRLDLLEQIQRTKDSKLKEELMVQLTMIEDKIYARFNVEIDSYDLALVEHGLVDNPEVKRMQAVTEGKVPFELRKSYEDMLRTRIKL